MNYRIIIEKIELNPIYEQELKTFQDGLRWGSNNLEPPSAYKAEKFLFTILTEEEFKVIKRACLSVMGEDNETKTQKD